MFKRTFKTFKQVYNIRICFVFFWSYIRGKQCLYKRKYTPKHGTSNPGHGNEVTSTCLTHANDDENICYKFDHKHSTTLDIQTELQTYVIFFLTFDKL